MSVKHHEALSTHYLCSKMNIKSIIEVINAISECEKIPDRFEKKKYSHQFNSSYRSLRINMMKSSPLGQLFYTGSVHYMYHASSIDYTGISILKSNLEVSPHFIIVHFPVLGLEP